MKNIFYGSQGPTVGVEPCRGGGPVEPRRRNSAKTTQTIHVWNTTMPTTMPTSMPLPQTTPGKYVTHGKPSCHNSEIHSGPGNRRERNGSPGTSRVIGQVSHALVNLVFEPGLSSTYARRDVVASGSKSWQMAQPCSSHQLSKAFHCVAYPLET